MSETATTDENSSKNIYGDPPEISISLPGISELTPNLKPWENVQLPIDILLVTMKDCEFLSCYYYISDPFRSYCIMLGFIYFGIIGDNQDVKLKVALVKVPDQSKFTNNALTVVKNAAIQLMPKAVFFVGHCCGINQESTKLGDVVVSQNLKVCTNTIPGTRNFKSLTIPVSRNIDGLIQCAGHGWNPPLKNSTKREVEVHCGEVLMGLDVKEAGWQRDEVVKSFPKAIAIDTEGDGKISFSFEVTVTVKSAQRDIWIYLFPERES